MTFLSIFVSAMSLTNRDPSSFYLLKIYDGIVIHSLAILDGSSLAIFKRLN
jgi:hypothetical protein